MLFIRRKAEIEIIAGFPHSPRADTTLLDKSLIGESMLAMPRQTSLLVRCLANKISERLQPLDQIYMMEPSVEDHPVPGELFLLDF